MTYSLMNAFKMFMNGISINFIPNIFVPVDIEDDYSFPYTVMGLFLLKSVDL